MVAGDSLTHADRPFTVLDVDRFGEPIKIAATEPWMRGSFHEGSLNLNLALRGFGRELVAALPRRLRHWFQC